MNANITLLGRVTRPVWTEEGRAEEVEIRQFKIREYKAAFAQLDDEIGLVALATGRPRQFVETLHPESFEDVLAQVQELNAKGFFTFAGRKMEQAAAQMRQLPSAMVERIVAAGQPKSPSAPPWPTIAPPAA